MELSDPGLENEQIRLEIFGEAEKELIGASGAIQSLWDWMPRVPGRGTSYDSYFDYMMGEKASQRLIPFLAWRKSDNAFVGGTSFLDPNLTHRSVKIMNPWIMPEMRRSSMFTAMTAAMVRRASEWRARRVSWQVDTRNKPLRRALERMGIPQEGIMRSVARLNNGEWSDVVVYALVQDEIREAANRLESTLEPVD
ncbi:MAG: GNAT family protein [Pseudomonadota bacterium]